MGCLDSWSGSCWFPFALAGALALAGPVGAQQRTEPPPIQAMRPFLSKYCLSCHSAKKVRGSLDLESLASDDPFAKIKVWKKVWDRVRAHEMPPPTSPQ